MLLNILGYLLEITWAISFLYGTYCAVRAWTERLPRRHRHHTAIPTLSDFTPDGRRYLGRTWRAWAVAVGAILVATVAF